MEIPTLGTHRLTLRRPLARDLDLLVRYESNPVAMRFIGDGIPHDRAHAAATLSGFMAEWDRVGHGRWIVTLQGDGPAIGNCGFVRWKEGQQDARLELAFGYARQFWGRGYATEAARLALMWAWDTLAPDEIVALTRPGNLASQHVLGKLGFGLSGSVTLPRGEMSFFALRRP